MTNAPGSFLPDPVPDADRAEQARAAAPPDAADEPIAIAPDVPEADAMEQALPGPLPDEDDAPR